MSTIPSFFAAHDHERRNSVDCLFGDPSCLFTLKVILVVSKDSSMHANKNYMKNLPSSLPLLNSLDRLEIKTAVLAA